MKKQNYTLGKHRCYAYKRPVGRGWEVGFYFNDKSVFIGNFVHYTEANRWWTHMNNEIKKFPKKYWITPKSPISWYRTFFSNYLYDSYYKYLNRTFTNYQRNYKRALTKDQQHYRKIKKSWTPKQQLTWNRPHTTTYTKAA